MSALDTWELAQTCQTFNESRTEGKRDYKKFSGGMNKLDNLGEGFCAIDSRLVVFMTMTNLTNLRAS